MRSPAGGLFEYPRVWIGAPSVWGDTSVSMRWYWPSFAFPSVPLSFSFFPLRPPSSDPVLTFRELPEGLRSPTALLFLPFKSLPGEDDICFLIIIIPSSFSFLFPVLNLEDEEEPRKSLSLLLADGAMAASQGSLR